MSERLTDERLQDIERRVSSIVRAQRNPHNRRLPLKVNMLAGEDVPLLLRELQAERESFAEQHRQMEQENAARRTQGYEGSQTLDDETLISEMRDWVYSDGNFGSCIRAVDHLAPQLCDRLEAARKMIERLQSELRIEKASQATRGNN